MTQRRNADWATSYTGSFEEDEMSQLLHSLPGVEMLSSTDRRMNALTEYTRRGEWRKAAQVARQLVREYYAVKDEIEQFLGAYNTMKLLDSPLENLPTILE